MNPSVLFASTDTLQTATRRQKGINSFMYLALLFLTAMIMSGCAALQRPNLLENSMEVNRLIESDTILPGYTYYYTGPQDKPDTIIAIRNDYELQESIYWHKVDITEKQLQTWNMMIDNRHRIRFTYDGAYIITPEGQRVGIWYSKYSLTVIKFPEPGRIIIYPPDPTSQQRWQEGIYLRNN